MPYLDAKEDFPPEHKDLFDTLSEAQYLGELGPHDDGLLESLVEKGCEDNQLLQLDKLANLVQAGYGGEVPVADLIERLERELSPAASAAHGLLSLHRDLPPAYCELEYPAAAPAPAEAYAEPADAAPYAPAPPAPEPEPQEDFAPADADPYPADRSEPFTPERSEEPAFTSSADDAAYPPEIAEQSAEEYPTTLTGPPYPSDSSDTAYHSDPNRTEYSSDHGAEYASNHSNDPEYQSDASAADYQPDPSGPDYQANMNEQQAFASETSETAYQSDTHEPTDHYQIAPADPETEYKSTPEECGETEIYQPNEDRADYPNADLSDPGYSQDREFPPVNHDPCDLSDQVNPSVETVIHAPSDSLAQHEDISMDLEISCNEMKKEYTVDENMPKDLSMKTVEILDDPPPVEAEAVVELPKDLTITRRAPSRESDSMQSPQPSGIPAVPSSPELFTPPLAKTKQALFLESLLSSPSPKMYTSEVTITKHQCEPLNLGKHRKSASPTVSSCSDDLKKLKDYGEPLEKRRRESCEELMRVSKLLAKTDGGCQAKRSHKVDENSPLKQVQVLKSSSDFNIPDPLVIPRDRLLEILASPGREIPALLIQRPELRLDAANYHNLLQDPDFLVISLNELENVLVENDGKVMTSRASETRPKNSSRAIEANKPEASQGKPELAGEIDAATINQMQMQLWLQMPYINQLEAAVACSQNMDLVKALNASGYQGSYQELSQMIHNSRYGGGFPQMTQAEYDSRVQYAMWQEVQQAARKANSAEQLKELAKACDLQNSYVHSTKKHSSARTSPVVHSYAPRPNHYLQMYSPRPPAPLPGLQIPYFNPALMSQRSPRNQQSPTSPCYGGYMRRAEPRPAESPRPRISVRNLQNLLEPAGRRAPRRRDEEVSTTAADTPPPHPHDAAQQQLWHPLFGNQKGYNSPWSWTTVTATGD